MKTIREVLLANRAWANETRERKKDYFARQTSGQNPEIMWIGGSDSRISPHQISQNTPRRTLDPPQPGEPGLSRRREPAC